jgi:hypothetical protein
VPLAEWSGETAIENEQDKVFTFIIGEAEGGTIEIYEAKLGGFLIDTYLCHMSLH